MNIKSIPVKLLEENRRKLHDISLGNDFFYASPKTKATRVQTENWNNIKIEVFSEQNRVIKQPSEWEKTLTNHTSDKGLSNLKIGKKLE